MKRIMKFVNIPSVSRSLSGRQGGKTFRDKSAGQRQTRRRVLGVLLIPLIVYCALKLYKGINQLLHSELSNSTIHERTPGPWFKAKGLGADIRQVDFDVTGSDEDFLMSLSRFGTKPRSCTDATKTCVGTLMMVNRGAIDLYRNFLYYLAKLDLRQYDFIVCTSDEEVASLALSNDQRVIMVNNNQIEGSRLDFGTPRYQLAISVRTRIINVLLKANMYDYWLIADTDSVWLCNPFEVIFDADFIRDPFDIGGQVDLNRICGGFLVLKTSSAVQEVWSEVTSIHENIIKRTNIDTAIEKTEQGILHELISDEARGIRVKQFSKELFPSGFDYFEDGFREKACVVHNNFIVGIDPKIDRFKGFNLWMDEDSDSMAVKKL